MAYLSGFLLLSASIIYLFYWLCNASTYFLYIFSYLLESVAFTKNTLVGQTQKFIHKIFSSLLDLAHKVSFHCEGLKSHLYNLKPSQLPPWCYIICVLHGNDTLVFYWFSGHFENVEYGYYYYYYCTTMDWRSSLTPELTLLLLISLSLPFISETSCFS